MISVNSQKVKLLNQMAILRSIQVNDTISRQQIARTTRLSNSTISILVGELIASGIVKELGEGESSGGRRSKLLGINEEGGTILAVDLGSSNITCAIVDLRANIREKRTIDAPAEPNERLPAVIELLKTMREVGRAKGMDNFLGVGVAVSGFVDPKNGIIISASNMGWKNIHLKKEIEYATGLTTSIDNVAKAGALAEYYYGTGVGADHLLYIEAGSGIGAGFIVNGSLITGLRNAAGEIGHLQMVQNGLVCKCGKIGCLETIASGKAIERKAFERREQSALLQSYYDRHGKITAEYVFDCAKKDDPAALSIIDEAIEFTAIATANILSMFNPELIVFGGGLANAGAFYLDRITHKLELSLIKDHNKGVQIKLSSLGRNSSILGAATLVIERLFRPIEAIF
ncbi:MAG: Glucokinase [Paenibacillus sp.]|nr:Glucokinase [Paenibacillus sp.]